jgi:hypothetical protein
LREAVRVELGLSIHKGILELDRSSNIVMARLDNALQKRVVLKLKGISWIELVQLWHQLLQVSLSCNIFLDGGAGAEVQASSSGVLKGLMEGILIVLLVESDNSNTGLGSSHLSDQDLCRVALIKPDNNLVSWSISCFD